MSNTNGFVNLPVGIYLNVRQEPNLYSTVLTSLAPKTELTILEQNGDWYKINYNNSIAYVFASAIETTSKINEGGISLNFGVPNNFEFGDTGEQPTFNWNALVTTSLIPIKNSSGIIQNGYSTSNGDHITIIKNNPKLGLTFIQYPDQGANMYQQGWIDSSYISSEYLDFRFSQAWINQVVNQKVYLFDNTICPITLNQNAKYTLLYTLSNYNIEYSCIVFEENGQQQLGFIPFETGKLNFIVPEYPYNIFNECSVGYLEPTIQPNATVNSNVELIDINGIKPYYYINKKKATIYPSLLVGDRISIIQAFTSAKKKSILIEYYDSSSNTYKKAYLPIEALNNNSISIDKNTITWNNAAGTYDLVDLTDSNIIYELPASQSAQYLYTVGDFACILFNNNNLSGWPLQTGYTKLSNGTFVQEVPEIVQEQQLNLKINKLENIINAFIQTENSTNKQLNTNLNSLNSIDTNLNNSLIGLEKDVLKNKQSINNSISKVKELRGTKGLIGGINLINNSPTNFGVNGYCSNAYGFGTGTVTLYKGRTYTLTVCGSNSQEAIDNEQHLLVDMYNEAWTEIASLNFNEITPTIKQVNITVPETETYWIDAYSWPHKADSKDVTIYWYNVQEGEIGTTWAPSIADLQNILNTNNEI